MPAAVFTAPTPASARAPSLTSTSAGPASAAQSAVQTRPQYGRRIKRRYDEENHGDAQHLPSTSLLPPQLQVEGSQASPAATSAIGAKPVANNRNAAWAHAAAAPSTDMAESTATPPAESSSSRVTVDAATGGGGFALMGSSTDERGPAGEHAMSNVRSASASSRVCSRDPRAGRSVLRADRRCMHHTALLCSARLTLVRHPRDSHRARLNPHTRASQRYDVRTTTSMLDPPSMPFYRSSIVTLETRHFDAQRCLARAVTSSGTCVSRGRLLRQSPRQQARRQQPRRGQRARVCRRQWLFPARVHRCDD